MIGALNQNEAGKKDSCIFCDIVSGVVVAEIVFNSDDTLFFYDISPKAPVHVVGIPKIHVGSLNEVNENNSVLMGKLLTDVSKVAKKMGLGDSGYRVITNVGKDAGQEVEHLHLHILGGESLGSLRC